MRKSDLGMRLVVEMQELHQYHQYNILTFYPPSMVTLGAADVTSNTSCELHHCTQPVCLLRMLLVRTVCYHNLPRKYVHVKRILVAPLEGDGHLAVYPHSCLYPCRSGDKAHWRSCKCYYFAILLTHVVLLGYSSLVPKPLVQGYSC